MAVRCAICAAKVYLTCFWFEIFLSNERSVEGVREDSEVLGASVAPLLLNFENAKSAISERSKVPDLAIMLKVVVSG